jgi:hypothetical protein
MFKDKDCDKLYKDCSESQSHVTTDGQSASLSWCQAPSGSQDQIFFYCQTVAGLLTPSLTWERICRLQSLLTLASAVNLSGPGPAGFMIIFYSLRSETPQVPVFTSPRDGVAQLYSLAVGSLLVASNNSRGYGGVTASTRTTLCINLQFVPHRKHITSPLQTPIG